MVRAHWNGAVIAESDDTGTPNRDAAWCSAWCSAGLLAQATTGRGAA
jgi:hypothetical protein